MKPGNIYSDNNFIMQQNDIKNKTPRDRKGMGAGDKKNSNVDTGDNKSVSDLEYQESAYLTAKS